MLDFVGVKDTTCGVEVTKLDKKWRWEYNIGVVLLTKSSKYNTDVVYKTFIKFDTLNTKSYVLNTNSVTVVLSTPGCIYNTKLYPNYVYWCSQHQRFLLYPCLYFFYFSLKNKN